ncbi:MAG: M67 family metallopeptidase [Chloroflexi bacterium AL-W]|nr:M67 family metallopeptidase [Chloroflexi bacterium AL-N1]NOK68889.1 M67 family metallopeptidase [Chloroflexi bacterium AL-N10]NOK76872.1 M67 family metallopeptidase [Chloroflexi bacterium AL-N5]NOK82740.1 M67 family metallopeptidase [Chloroflexi bacterium AL-W]NOK90729.1 M67 family metallopeptidase [Chloroflexi bacterium AL-N15]
MLVLSEQIKHDIATHAESTYPNECVGLLLGLIDGDSKVAVAVHPVENRWQGQVTLADTDDATSQRDRFYLDPRDYLAADRAARNQSLDIIGCYHSHPDHPAVPSERDRIGSQSAGGGISFSFVIQSVQAGQATEIASWLLMDNGQRFVAEPITEPET